MRLLRLEGKERELRTALGDVAGDKVRLYVDHATGVVYALTLEQADARDPLWRQADE